MANQNGSMSRTGLVRLRPYQTDAIERLRARVQDGLRRGVLVAPTGSGKCTSPHTMVWNRGLRRFGDIWGADCIAGPYGLGNVTGWYDDGERDGYEVALECGAVIDGTPAHRVWVRSTDGFEGWRRVGELTGDDYVAMARGQADFGSESIPFEEAHALGVLVADGCIVGNRLQINNRRAVLEHIRPVVRYWRNLAGNAGGMLRIADAGHGYGVLTSYANFRALFQDIYGLGWGISEHRQVPASVLEGSREVVQAFLRGYFDGDGYCDRKPAVSTASPRLARQARGSRRQRPPGWRPEALRPPALLSRGRLWEGTWQLPLRSRDWPRGARRSRV